MKVNWNNWNISWWNTTICDKQKADINEDYNDINCAL